MKKPEFPKPRIIREGFLPEKNSHTQRHLMKRNSFDLSDYITVFVIGIIILAFVGAPIVGIGRVITTQQALNQECKTNYNLLQVALSGDNLARLCQIKNQTITVK